MAASVPWSVSAVDPEAWATARDAARRSGLSVGEWLESAIRESANEPVRPHRGSYDSAKAIEQRLDDLGERLDHFARRAGEAPQPSRGTHGELALFASVDALNDRIDSLTRDMRGDRNGPAEVRAAIQRLDSRIDELLSRSRLTNGGTTPELERKVEEIARTIESLSHRLERENARYSAAPRPAGIDELDAAVADIVMRQSALDGVPPQDVRRAPAVPTQDFSRFENQLKTLADEMQAIRRAGVQAETVDALRREVGSLAHQLADLAPRRSIEALETAVESLARRFDRMAGNRPDETTEVIRALHDIRTALAEVRPAESFTSVEKDLHDLSSKLDNLNARGIDSGTVARLQDQTAEIRDLLSGALPSDVLKALVEQIELLVRKFESGNSAPDHGLLDMVSGVDRRIAALSERIDVANRQGPAQGALDEIRTRLDELQGALADAGKGSAAGIEASLRALSQKVDAADTRLGNLGTIERGLNDLFKQLAELRSGARDIVAQPVRDTQGPVADGPRRPLTELDIKYSSTNVSEQSAIAPARADPTPTVGRAAALAETYDPQADTPLEPGSGAPRMRMQSAALRVAQSEAALGGIGATASTTSRTSDFIAAARRAAQAAAAEPTREPSRIVEATVVNGIIAKFGGGRRALLIALTAFLVIFTALRLFPGSLPSFLFSAPSAPVTDVPGPAEPVPSRPEQNAPTSQDRSSLSESSNIAAAPPAGVIGGSRDLPFFGNIAADPATTGTTVAAKPAKTPIQTASTPPTAEEATNIPAALGTPALRAAAAAGDPLAAYEIGARYLEGRGVRADPAEAASWLERALAKGSMLAAYRLGNINEKGHGVTKNPSEAMRYYTIAAEGGNIKAMHNLAVMYAEGPDGKPDYRTAARWFRMAAERSVRDSQYNLGVLYARGLGVEQNLTESYRWFSLASNQGDTDAGKKRDDVAKRLDVQTLVAAKLAIQTWTATPADASANEVQLKPEWDTADGQPRKRSVKK
jgi:localization factor PodJL